MITTKAKLLENAERWEAQNEKLVKELGFTEEFTDMVWKAIKRYSDVVECDKAADFAFDEAFKNGEDTSEFLKECEAR